MQKSSDNILIIGAGVAGLTTAAYLARAGLKVDVYEQHTLPGGYISSFVREGFTFPAASTARWRFFINFKQGISNDCKCFQSNLFL